MDDEFNITDDEMFSYDIENDCNIPKLPNNNKENKNEVLESLIQPKSILYKVKDNDDITMVIIKTIVTFFIICFIILIFKINYLLYTII